MPVANSTLQDLIEAVSTYHGELLPGFYEEWVFADRDRLFAFFEAKVARLLEILQNEGRWAEIPDWAMRWIAVGHWPEPAYRALMLAYANNGDTRESHCDLRAPGSGPAERPGGQTLRADPGTIQADQSRLEAESLRLLHAQSKWQLFLARALSHPRSSPG